MKVQSLSPRTTKLQISSLFTWCWHTVKIWLAPAASTKQSQVQSLQRHSVTRQTQIHSTLFLKHAEMKLSTTSSLTKIVWWTQSSNLNWIFIFWPALQNTCCALQWKPINIWNPITWSSAYGKYCLLTASVIIFCCLPVQTEAKNFTEIKVTNSGFKVGSSYNAN